MKTHLLVLVLCVCSIQMFYSQEDDGVVSLSLLVRNSLTFNRFTINPTFSFVRSQNKYISIYNKREWVQFEDAPLTYLASYSGRFGENIGAGLGAFQQNYGVLTTFGGVLNFAYNARLARDSNLTFGLNIGAYKSGINTANVVTNFDDPSIQKVPENFLISITPGINYSLVFFDFGLSINNFAVYNFKSSNLVEDNPEQGVQAHVMYTGYMTSRGFFDESKFTGLLKSEFRKDESIISAITRLMVPKGIWAQVGYNTLYGASAGIGLNITSQIAIEYNYEKALGDLTDFGPSHDITLAYKFKNNSNYDYSGDDKVSGLISLDKKRRPVSKISKSKAEANRKLAAETKAKALAEQKAKEDAEIQAKLLADQKAKEAAKIQAERIAQEKAQIETEAQAKQLAEQKANEEAEVKAKLEAERVERVKAEVRAKITEIKAKEKSEALAKLVAIQKNKEEAEAKAKQLAEQKAKAEAKKAAEQEAIEAARLLAEQKIKEEAKAQALLIAKQQAQIEAEARAVLIAEQKAKDDAEKLAKRIADQKEKEELITNPNDDLGKSMFALTQQTERSESIQKELLKRFDEIVETKDQDLKDLKNENDLSEQGIAVGPKPFKSITAENNALNAIKSDLDQVIKTRNEKIEALKVLYDDKYVADTITNDEVYLYYKKTIKRLTSEQLKAIDAKAILEARLENIKVATEFERRRRIKRAAFDNEAERHLQDRLALQNIKKSTLVSSEQQKSDDYDFGEEQGNTIQILKNVKHVENGYYLIIAVHSDIDDRNEFITKVVASGRNDIDFFYDINTSKYYIYYDKFDSIEDANEGLKLKGNTAYNINMSLVKIEN